MIVNEELLNGRWSNFQIKNCENEVAVSIVTGFIHFVIVNKLRKKALQGDSGQEWKEFLNDPSKAINFKETFYNKTV